MDLTFQVPMQYCSLQHSTLRPSPVTFTNGYCFCFGSVSSLFMELFLHWSPVAYWAPITWRVHLSVSYLFAFSCCSWNYQGKNTEVVCHSLLQWTMFFQNSPPWAVHPGWPYMAWLIVSLSQTRLWSMWSVWLFIVDHPEFPAQVPTRLPSGYQWGVFLSGSQDPLPSLWGCQQNSVPCSCRAEGPSFFLVVTGVLSWAFSQHWLLETTKYILINPRVKDVRYHVKSSKKK